MRTKFALVAALVLPAMLTTAGCGKKSSGLSVADANASAVNVADTSANATKESFPLFSTSREEAGRAAPMTAIFQGPGGSMATLAKFAGKPFLVYLWSQNLPDAVAALPSLDGLAREGKLAVVAVNVDPRPSDAFPDLVSPFMATHKYKALADYRDPKSTLKHALGNPIPPQAILYDSQGKQILQISYGSFADPKVRALIDEAK